VLQALGDVENALSASQILSQRVNLHLVLGSSFAERVPLASAQ
jgi:hypothetical protein